MPALDRPLLGHMVDRIKKVPSITSIVLATTTSPGDEILVDFARQNEIAWFRGSEEDVMERVIGAASSVQADIVCELTGDCPLIDPGIIEQAIQMFLNHSVDYVGNSHVRSYPDGMDVQVYKLSTLKKSSSMTKDKLDREHVTRHIIQHPEIFTRIALIAPSQIKYPEMCLTLDEPADYDLIKKVYEYFKKDPSGFTCEEVVNLLTKVHPEWLKINEHVKRKGLNQ